MFVSLVRDIDSPEMRRAGRELLSVALMDARNHTLHLADQLHQAMEQAGARLLACADADPLALPAVTRVAFAGCPRCQIAFGLSAVEVAAILAERTAAARSFGMTLVPLDVDASSPFVEVGGLASYGPDQVAMAAYSMSYVDKILRGAKPADLPVDMPSQYRLALHLRAAKELDLAIPQSLLLRADDVIQ